IIAESRCEVLLIPVSLFQSVIVAEPGAIQHISRTIAERVRLLAADPAKTAAALRKGDDPYGLKLKGERPEKILVINCGSSSLKYSFYDTTDESRHARGLVERIGIDGTRLVHRGPKGEVKRELGSTRHWPVPSGDPLDGTRTASLAARDAGSPSTAATIPAGGSPTGPGESPGPPSAGFAEAFKAMVAELTAKEGGVIGGAGEV